MLKIYQTWLKIYQNLVKIWSKSGVGLGVRKHVKKDGRLFLVHFWCQICAHFLYTRFHIYFHISQTSFVSFLHTFLHTFGTHFEGGRKHVSYRNSGANLVTLSGSDSDTKAATTY